MRGMWALAVVSTCVVAGLAGLTSAMAVAGSAHEPGRPALELSLLPALVAPFRAGLGMEDAPGRIDAAVPRTSTATRHVRSPGQAAETGELHPATDRVMILLVGWVLLASLGGGLLAPRH